jgi:hypothetical protein
VLDESGRVTVGRTAGRRAAWLWCERNWTRLARRRAVTAKAEFPRCGATTQPTHVYRRSLLSTIIIIIEEGTGMLADSAAFVLFVCVLVAFVAESELTQVHCFPNIHPPFRANKWPPTVCPNDARLPPALLSLVRLSFIHLSIPPAIYRLSASFASYVVHSSFIIIFPAHLLYLATHQNPRHLVQGVINAIKLHLAPKSQKPSVSLSSPFPTYKFARLAVLCTVGATVPALLWFASVSLAPYVLPQPAPVLPTHAFRLPASAT